MARWWECKVCAVDLGEYGADCLDHREQTGHVGAQVVMGQKAYTPGTAAGRAKARQIAQEALRKAGNRDGRR